MQNLNEIINALQRANEDLYSLFNISEVLTQCIRYQKCTSYMCTILAYLRHSLTYMRHVAIHTMDYVDASTTTIVCPDVLPVENLGNMLRYIDCELPSPMHLPISLDDTLYFYLYLSTHVLITEGQFLFRFKYMMFSIYQFCMVTYQPSIKLTSGI